MTTRLLALLGAFAGLASAQLTDYLGPGVLTRGAGSIGQRAGQDVDLRFFTNVTGIYDTGIQPVGVDADGEITDPGGLYGVEATLGVYGRHRFRRSLLGLDYSGNYRHYTTNSFFNGSNHQLALGYTHQKSQRLVFDTSLLGGTTNLGTNFNAMPRADESVVDPSLLIFDNRTNYIQGGAGATYLMNSRTSVSVGGSAYTVRRQSSALVSVNGYSLRGSIQRRLSQVTTVGLNYSHTHYDYANLFGESDINSFTGLWARGFGRRWTMRVSAGAFFVETQGLQRVAVDPAITRLLGITSVLQTFYRKNVAPTGAVTLTRQFRNASWSAEYSRSFNPGNGVFLTSRQESYGTNFDYTGVRKWRFAIGANRSRMDSIGQDIQPFEGYYGNVNVGYALTEVLHLTANFGVRHQDIGANVFQRTATRVAFGFAFSPGNIPISFR